MKTAIVLSGGGSKGDFEVGALHFLYDRLGIQPDVIVSTSVGSVNALKLAEGEGAPDQGLAGLTSMWLDRNSQVDFFTEAPWVSAIPLLGPWFKAYLHFHALANSPVVELGLAVNPTLQVLHTLEVETAKTVLGAARAFGVSPSAVSHKMVEVTAQKLKAFQTRSLAAYTPFALFLDTVHRGGEAFFVALGVDLNGVKMALGFWQGSSENHEICEALFRDLERRGLVLSRRILFVTDGGSGLRKALRERFGKKLVHQRCAIHKARNLQRYLAKRYRSEAHHRFTIALEQTHYAEARQMLLELEAWLRTKNESAADSLLEAFEELLTVHRLMVPALLRKTLLSTNPIESMFSLVRHSERNIKRSRGSAMPQRWLGTVLLYCEQQSNRVKGFAGIAQVMATIEAEQAEPPQAQTKKAA